MADYYTTQMAELIKGDLETNFVELLPEEWKKHELIKSSPKGTLILYKKGEVENHPVKISKYVNMKDLTTFDALELLDKIINDNKIVSYYSEGILEDKLNALGLGDKDTLIMTMQEYNNFMDKGRIPEGKIMSGTLWSEILFLKES